MADANHYDGNRYDGNHADEDRGTFGSPDAYESIRSKTPAERRAQSEARELQRQHDSQKGADGLERTSGGIIRPTTELTNPGGQHPLYRVTVGLCVAGAAGHMDVAAYELPTPN